MFETGSEPLDLLWIVFDQIHKQTLAASTLQELDCPFDCNHRRASDWPPFKFILPRPGEAIKVCKLAVPGTQDIRPRRKVLLEDYVFYPRNAFEMLQLFATGRVGLVFFVHSLYIRFLFAHLSSSCYLALDSKIGLLSLRDCPLLYGLTHPRSSFNVSLTASRSFIVALITSTAYATSC